MELLSDNKKYKRISEILRLLKSRSASTVELARRFGVSEKTISRDMEILQKSGIKKEKKLWIYDENAICDGLSSDEMVVLGILGAISKNMGADFFHTSSALLKRISDRSNYSVFANLQDEILSEKELENFNLIENAIANKNVIKCEYKGRSFTVKPLKIALFDGFWYLFLLDCSAGDQFKRFYFKEIKNAKITEAKFQIPDKFEKRLKSANSVWFELESPHTAWLLIMPNVVKYFERKNYINGDIMCHNSDGSIEIECEFSHIMEIKPLIYRFLPHIKVIEPSWVNEKIKAEISEYLQDLS